MSASNFWVLLKNLSNTLCDRTVWQHFRLYIWFLVYSEQVMRLNSFNQGETHVMQHIRSYFNQCNCLHTLSVDEHCMYVNATRSVSLLFSSNFLYLCVETQWLCIGLWALPNCRWPTLCPVHERLLCRYRLNTEAADLVLTRCSSYNICEDMA